MKSRVVSGVKSVAGLVVVAWFSVLFWVGRSVYEMRLPFRSVVGVKFFAFWLGFTVWVFWSSSVYRRKNAASRVHDDSSDKPQFFVSDFWQGPLASFSWGFGWMFRNWPSQVCSLLVAVWCCWAFSPLVGVEMGVYLFVFVWGWFSWVGLKYGDPVFGRFTRRSRGAEDAVTFASGVKSLDDGGLGRIEYGAVKGDARIPVKAWIQPDQREAAAAQLASKVEGAVRWDISEGSDGMVIETFGSFGGEHQRLAAWLKDSPDFKGDVKGVSVGDGWVVLEVPAGRTVKGRREAADSLLKASEGYFFRGEPDVSGDGDRIRVKLWDRFPNRSAEILESFVNPVLGEKFSFVPVVVDGWGAAFEVGCGPSPSDRWGLAEKVRAVIPGAELSAEPEVLGDGDRIRLKFLPDEVTDEMGDQLAWNRLTEEIGNREPCDPPLRVRLVRRDDDGRLCEVVYRSGAGHGLKEAQQIEGLLADTLEATSSRVELLPDSSYVRLSLWYNSPARLLTLHEEDLPTLKKGKKHPPVEARALVDTSYYSSDEGFFLGLTKWGEPVYVDYSAGAYHFGLWGMTGSGKGLTLIGMILHSILMGYRVTVISTKTADFQWAKNYGVKIVTVNKSDDILRALDLKLKENDRRERLCTKYAITMWSDLVAFAERLAERGDSDLLDELGETRREYIFFDEMEKCMEKADLEGKDDDGVPFPQIIEKKVKAVLLAGRSASVGLGVITQSPLAAAMSAGGSSSTRSNVQARIWAGRGEVKATCMAMGISDKSPPPAIAASEAHSIGNFLIKGRCDGPEAAELLTGRTPFISTDYAAVLVWLLKPTERNRDGAARTRKRLEGLRDIGELPGWLESMIGELPEMAEYETTSETVYQDGTPVEPLPTTVVDSEEEVWVELEDGSTVLAGDDDVGNYEE